MAAKKSKIPHVSTEIIKKSKYQSLESVLSAGSFEAFPGREQWLERLGFTIKEWAKKDTSTQIKKFFLEKDIHEGNFYELMHRSPGLAEDFQRAKDWIYTRRLDGAMNRGLDKEVALRDLYRYSPEADEINRYCAAMSALAKEKEETRGNVFNITMTTPEVIGKTQMQSITDGIGSAKKALIDETVK